MAIAIQGVSKAFGGTAETVRALNNVDLEIGQNEFFTLLGPSGCGKTTLLRLIAGFEFPTEGRIMLHGEDIAALPPYRRPVNAVFQSYALFPHMSVSENIGFGLEMLGHSKSAISDRVDEMLKLVQMTDLRNRKTNQISGGQQQRVALARALAPNPKVLLLDEPLSALDYKLRKDMQIELKRLQSETGITFIFVTHDQEEALTMSDRIAVMSKGEILQVGAPRDIYLRPARRFVADFIGETNFLQGQASPISDKQLRVQLDVGGSVTIEAEGVVPGPVTIMLRPEQVCISERPTFKGRVENVVYFGTDTHVHLKLGNGAGFTLRQQNTGLLDRIPKVGDEVGIEVAPGTARVIED